MLLIVRSYIIRPFFILEPKVALKAVLWNATRQFPLQFLRSRSMECYTAIPPKEVPKYARDRDKHFSKFDALNMWYYRYRHKLLKKKREQRQDIINSL